eukprot:244302_1
MLSGAPKLANLPLRLLQRARYHAPIQEKSNLLLMGPPGSGKTSIGRLLAKSLNMSVYDVDDDHLEKTVWKQPVATKLSELGDDQFLAEEAKAAMLITPETHQNTIISLTGSNPLNAEAMHHLRNVGVCIYLDCDQNEIVKRCHKMKVNRIVGQSTKSLEEILSWRHNIYEDSYDIRIVIEDDESQESISNKIVHLLQNEIGANKQQTFVSTRNNAETQTLSGAISNGLSPDGGLYLPQNLTQSLHKFTPGELNRILSENKYHEVALRVLETFPLDEHLKSSKFREFLSAAYSPQLFSNEKDIIPLSKLNDKLYLMELFHGKTASFKDMALNVFPKLFLNAAAAQEGNGKERLFVVATSGDTGSSVLNGFDAADKTTPIVILYPKNGISKIQEMQIEKFGVENPNNVLVLGIEKSDFDFCQNVVKSVFDNDKFKDGLANDYRLEYQLSSANSINWARFLPQIPFYFWGYKQLMQQMENTDLKEFDLCIPTGNFGHILGAILAKRMGVPIRKLIVATNSNCVLYDFINDEQGVFTNKQRTLDKTHSPSIDILLPSNLERYLRVIGEEKAEQTEALMTEYKTNKCFKISEGMLKEMQDELLCGKASDAECLKMIKYVYDEYNVKVDPHTAIGIDVANSFVDVFDAGDDNVPMIVAATAHYSKFPEALLEALAEPNKYDFGNLKYDQLFDILENDFKSKNELHPSIKDLVYSENDNVNTEGRGQVCEAKIESVIDKIKSFLQKRDLNIQQKN